jgi:hypothetical protein
MYKIIILAIIVILIISYGIYKKNENEKIYRYFFENKIIKCNDTYVQKSKGWYIKSNRFFSNGRIFKTIIFCKVL